VERNTGREFLQPNFDRSRSTQLIRIVCPQKRKEKLVHIVYKMMRSYCCQHSGKRIPFPLFLLRLNTLCSAFSLLLPLLRGFTPSRTRYGRAIYAKSRGEKKKRGEELSHNDCAARQQRHGYKYKLREVCWMSRSQLQASS
jgi:hypothetical protein